MKYINIDYKGKVNDKQPFFATGTSLMGRIDVSYKELVNIFGKPNELGDDYKVDAMWLIFTPDGVATIYNYKDGKNYLGNEGLAIKDITDWHIGGKNKEVVTWIKKAVKNEV